MINLYHFSIGRLISPQTVAADVGQNILEKPSPNWKASTAVCLVSPMASAKGAMIGIDVAACPEPEYDIINKENLYICENFFINKKRFFH